MYILYFINYYLKNIKHNNDIKLYTIKTIKYICLHLKSF